MPGAIAIAAPSRCAVSLATLPAIAKHHPKACIAWFDSHADLNTPEASTTGYSGGLALAAPAGLWQSGLGAGLRLDQIVPAGRRDLDPFEQALLERHGIPHIKPQGGRKNELRAAQISTASRCGGPARELRSIIVVSSRMLSPASPDSIMESRCRAAARPMR